MRELHTAGVDLIKLVYQGGRYGSDRVELNQLPAEVARAIVSEAHRLGLPVAAHTHYQDDVDTLLEFGVDSIEHGVIEHELTEGETLSQWAGSSTSLVPTLTIASLFPGPDGGLYIDQARANLTRAHGAGVRIVAGTDAMVGAMPANSLHEELRLMVEAGMSEAEALRAATADAATLLGLKDRGVIAEGRVADLVLLGSNPLERIENVADIELVLTEGRLVYRAPAPTRPPELSDYVVVGPDVLEYTDRTGATVSGEALLRYDRSRFEADGVRSLTYTDASSGEILRSESVTSGRDLVTQEWVCEIPSEQTGLRAVADARQITLTGTRGGKTVSRSYPLRGQTWMQLLQLDAATFITADEPALGFVAIGASGRGALQLTDFELTKTGSGVSGQGPIEAELVMPRWRRFWGAIVRYHAETGDLVHQHIRGKKAQTIQPREGAR